MAETPQNPATDANQGMPTTGSTDPGSTTPQPSLGFVRPPSTPSTPQTTQTSASTSPTQASPAVSPEMQHQSMIGRAVQSLMGTQNEYSVDPATGKTVVTPVKNKPGDLFRHILAGAIVGSAMGADQRTFARGAAKGAAGAVAQSQEADQQKRAQAQEDFRNQLVANKEQREAAGFETEQQMRQAQIAMYNMQTMRENHQMQGEDFKFHQQVAQNGQVKLDPYVAAGVPYKFRDVPETEMGDILKNNKGASTYDWEPTGTKLVKGADGNYTYVATYSAVDTNQSVKVTPDLLKLFKEVGMDKYDPAVTEILKPGKELTATQFVALKDQYQRLANEKYEKDKRAGDLNEQKARINKDNAEASRAYLEIKEKKLGLQKEAALDGALQELDKVGGDFSRLKPSSRIVISESTPKIIDSLNKGINTAMANGDEETAKQLIQQRDSMTKLASQAFTYNKPDAGTKPAVTASGAPASTEELDKQIKEARNQGDSAQVYKLQQQKKFSAVYESLKTRVKDLPNQTAYEEIDSSDLPQPQKLQLIKEVGAVVPWSVIEEQTDQLNMTARSQSKGGNARTFTPDQVVEMFKSQGLKVALPPTDEEQQEHINDSTTLPPVI